MAQKTQKKRGRGRPPKTEQTEKMVLRVDLEAELQADFHKIKQEQGLTNNTEVLRYCIREMASGKLYKIPDEKWTLMEELVEDPRIQRKYFISSVQDFLDRALHQFFEKANSDRSNLHDWTFKQTLDERGLRVANALIELQSKDPKGATIDAVTVEARLPKTVVVDQFKSFVARKLVIVTTIGDETYYFAPDRSYITEEPIDA